MFNHYSYEFYREPEFASEYELDRFGGRFGRFLKNYEVALFKSLLAEDGPVQSVLDVGTGTGKLAYAVATRDTVAFGMDASPEMVRQALQLRPEGHEGRVAFFVGDAHVLPFGDRSVDAVVSSRVLMHLVDWQKGLAEMCRVARRSVVFDVPPLRGFPALESLARRVLARFGAKTQAYRVFRVGQIRRSLQQNGYRLARVERSFVLPIAVHRKLGSPRLTVFVERLLGSLGLRRILGAPVTIHAVRED
ncbi:MAG: class I SAM-dependent methyltransferase [Calditrichaeota bacterium]|nr:class I SAM-dependent methyltransferase [Calditrichota bacterium]